MPAVERSAICRPSRRGHSWRELTMAEMVRAIETFAEGWAKFHHMAAMRVCKRCGRVGFVNDMGLITVTPNGPIV